MAEQKGNDIKFTHSDGKSPNRSGQAKDGSEKSPHHHKETHGTSDDINENTPLDEVKGPGVFQRAKEEIEAVVGAILPKK